MKKFSDFLEGRCWPGHKPVPGKKPFSPGSCMKEEEMEEDWSQNYKVRRLIALVKRKMKVSMKT